MSTFQRPLWISDVFNTSLYGYDESNTLTIYDADRRYLKLTGGTVIGLTTFNSNMTLNASLTFSGTVSGPIVNSNTYLLGGSSILASALTSITPGTAQASKALVLDASSNITSIGTIGQTVAAGGDMLVLTSSATTARNTIKFVTDNQSWEIGSRGSTAANPTNFYVYNGSYKLLMNPTGDTSILSSTDSTSATTGCLKLTGGLGVVKNIYCTGWLDLNRNGSNINITNPSSGTSGLIEIPASVSMLRLVRGFAVNICSSGITIESGSTRDARSVIDMGQSASNKQLALYNDTSSYYGISANNSACQLQSGGGFTFWSGCTNASPLGTKVFGVGSAGRLEIPNNQYIGNASYNNMIYLASTGTVLINSSTVQNSSNWLEVQGSSYFSGNCGYGITAASYPIHVNASSSDNITSYGYINTSGSTGFVSGSSGTIFVGIKCANRIVSGEINLVSDRRIKTDITDISDTEALAFLSIRPVHYTLRKCGTPSYGYIAQEIMKCQALKHNKYILDDIINICPEPDVKEEIDDDGFLNPDGAIFTVNYAKCVPLLHKIIQLQEEQINELKKAFNSHESKIQELSDALQDIYSMI
jgi:hypothetical protein